MRLIPLYIYQGLQLNGTTSDPSVAQNTLKQEKKSGISMTKFLDLKKKLVMNNSRPDFIRHPL